MSLIKTVRITERTNFELRAEFLNAFNNANFRADGSFTAGTVATGYRDVSTTNDKGGRMVQFVVRINFWFSGLNQGGAPRRRPLGDSASGFEIPE